MSTLSDTLRDILRDILNDLLSLIYPPRCLVCGEVLLARGSLICTKCFSTISYTRFWYHEDNPMSQHARDMQPIIENCAAMLFYDNYSRDMIHRMKYRGEWRIARYLGELFGSYLSCERRYRGVDVVIPVPLHPVRRIGRTYNQSEYIALGIAKTLGVKVNSRSLYRHRYTSAQAQKSKFERWSGGDDIFGVRFAKGLQGKHILLVDDVYTSGATIFRCVEALRSSILSCRISIATIAASTREFGL